SIEAHASRPVISDHRRYIDDCPLASLRHQRSKFRDEEVRHLDVERIHAVKHFFRRFMRRPEREDPRIVDQNIDMVVSERDRSSSHLARARRVSKVRRNKIGFASCCTDFRNRFLAALRIAADDDRDDWPLAGFTGQCRSQRKSARPFCKANAVRRTIRNSNPIRKSNYFFSRWERIANSWLNQKFRRRMWLAFKGHLRRGSQASSCA